MTDASLYRYSVVWATMGGLLMGLVGMIYQLVARAYEPVQTEAARTVAFRDARIIFGLSCLPQISLLLLPALYRGPQDVPVFLAPAAVFVWAALTCLWIWSLLKLLRAGFPNRTWYSRTNLAIFTTPLLCSLGVFVRIFFY